MNYFEFYDLPLSFNVDAGKVKAKFYELSKKYHPDFHISESQRKQEEVLELSTLNNKAYQVLSNKQKRVEYVLEMFGVITEGEKYELPQDFLMEMMEINEVLMELEFEPNPAEIQKLKKQILSIESKLDRDLDSLSVEFDSENGEDQKQTLLEIKDIRYRKKYLLRITDSLNRFASR